MNKKKNVGYRMENLSVGVECECECGFGVCSITKQGWSLNLGKMGFLDLGI